MFVELIDRLRCPAPHEDAWLVATAFRTTDRRILEGALGCPVCGAEYPILEGEVRFAGGEGRAPLGAPPADDAAATRLGAMLGLDERAGLYVLDGGWSRSAAVLSVAFPDARFVFLAAPEGAGASAVLRGTGDGIPLAAGAARGAAIERTSRELVHAAARVLAAGGRLVAPAATEVPAGITVLARDGTWWAGERASGASASAPITPRRAAPRTGGR